MGQYLFNLTGINLLLSLTLGFPGKEESALGKTYPKSSSTSLTPGYKETMKEVMQEVVGEIVADMMEAGPVRIAMLVSAIMFAQSSIMDYVTFVSTAFELMKSTFVLN